MKFKSDLKMDFETYQKNPDTPIFHRIRFDSTSIYLTKSTFYKLTTSRNEYGHYRLFSWDDWRAKAFLGFELGDQSPALGDANLIGRYTPTTDDLTDIQYDTSLGKCYFKSARHELEEGFNIEPREDSVKKQKINSYEFMKMNEIIPTGAQGKAIYGEGNYIIDGSAETGKSTTVLQKVKLLQKNDNIDTNKICILVKNEMVVFEFRKLLKSIGIDDLRIMTTHEFLSGYFDLKSDNNIKRVRNISIDIRNGFNKLINESSNLLSNNITRLGDNDRDIIRILAKNENVSKKINLYITKRKGVVELVLKNRKKINNEQRDIDERVKNFSKSISDKLKKKNEKNRGLRGIRALFSSKNDESLSLGDEAKVRDEINKYKST